MNIKLEKITIREIYNGYKDDEEQGVVAYGGKLNVRPAFQREFVYKDAQRDAVITTIMSGFPLNVMYWADSGDETYELMDGQQRTISFCQYCDGDFSINQRAFHNLTKEEQAKILDYEVMVYICEGTDKEKLDWFKIINIAGEKLFEQELRNAIYTGTWLADAKKYFSKTKCPAYKVFGEKYMTGSPIRQDLLETTIRWKADKDGLGRKKEAIAEYMSIHQHDPNANELWMYFNQVATWVQTVFPAWRKEMKGLEWGYFYNQYGDKQWDSTALILEVNKLYNDDEVENKKGIYEYLLSRNPKTLSLRLFSYSQKMIQYQKQEGICPMCKAENRANCHYEFEEMEGDHIKPWSEGGRTTAENLQMICKEHNRMKSNK